MRKITLLFMLLLGVVGADAKTKSTILWEGTSLEGSEINLSSSLFSGATSGDVIRVTFSFTSAGSMHLCYKTGENNDWNAKSFSGISEWPNYNNTSVTSADFSINDTDLSTLKSYGMYVYGFTTSTITKIELLHELSLSSTGDNLLSETWTPTEESNKPFDALAGAKIGDVILVNVSCPAGWLWTEFYVRDKDGNDFTNAGHYGKSFAEATDDTYEYVINNLSDLKKICTNGFIIRAKVNCTITSVRLLSYEDSYGYTTISIGESGYATWSSDKKYDFKSAGIQAYYASSVTTGAVTLTPMDITWDWQGYIIKGEAGEYDVLQSLTTDGTYYPTTNYLKYNIYESEVYDSGKNRYIFAMKNNDISSVGFYKLAASHTLAAHKAYLETADDITPPANARVALVFDDGITTSIRDVHRQTVADGTCYTISGQRVEQPSKGLYIVNGKKVIIK